MANIQSQLKRIRQDEKRRVANKGVRTALKSSLKRFETAAEEGDKATAETAFADASRDLDRAASKGIVHKNKAANKKSRMAARLQKL